MNGPHLLLVDDDKLSLKALMRICRGRYQIHCANSAEEALAQLRADHVDIVLTDQIMPQMTGVELLTEVAATAPHVARILMTASANDETAEALSNGVAQAVLEKPFGPDELQAETDRLMS